MTLPENPEAKSMQRSGATNTTQDSRFMNRAIGIGIALEIVLVIVALNAHAPAPTPVVERPMMTAELVKPDTPPPPPPPPLPKITPQIQKIVTHHPVATPPKPQPPTPTPQVAPVIPAAATPSPTAPAVATPGATTPVAPASPPVAHNTPIAIGIACPGQTHPEMPEIAVAENITGSVTARATISHGKVVRVDIIRSNPKGIFDQAVRDAMLQYRCQSNAEGDVVAEQTFRFDLSD